MKIIYHSYFLRSSNHYTFKILLSILLLIALVTLIHFLHPHHQPYHPPLIQIIVWLMASWFQLYTRVLGVQLIGLGKLLSLGSVSHQVVVEMLYIRLRCFAWIPFGIQWRNLLPGRLCRLLRWLGYRMSIQILFEWLLNIHHQLNEL